MQLGWWEGSCCLEVGVQQFFSIYLSNSHWYIDYPSVYQGITQHLLYATYMNKVVKVPVFVGLMVWQETDV